MRYDAGLKNRKGEVSGIAIPVLTPERAEKRQNGRRFKENEEPMFTLTNQDRHGVAIDVKIKEATRGGIVLRQKVMQSTSQCRTQPQEEGG